jgi:hypothetical protein
MNAMWAAFFGGGERLVDLVGRTAVDRDDVRTSAVGQPSTRPSWCSRRRRAG